MEIKQGKYTEEEIGLIKNTFYESEDLLIALRNFMLQLDEKKENLTVIQRSPDVLAVLRKAFLAEFTGKEYLGAVTNQWDQIDLNNKLPEQAYADIMATDLEMRYFEQQLSLLEGKPVATTIELAELHDVNTSSTDMDLFINLLAYQRIVRGTQAQLNMLTVFAAKKDETKADMLARLSKNSTK